MEIQLKNNWKLMVLLKKDTEKIIEKYQKNEWKKNDQFLFSYCARYLIVYMVVFLWNKTLIFLKKKYMNRQSKNHMKTINHTN